MCITFDDIISSSSSSHWNWIKRDLFHYKNFLMSRIIFFHLSFFGPFLIFCNFLSLSLQLTHKRRLFYEQNKNVRLLLLSPWITVGRFRYCKYGFGWKLKYFMAFEAKRFLNVHEEKFWCFNFNEKFFLWEIKHKIFF